MEKSTFVEYQSGRRFVGCLPGGKDVILAIEALCRSKEIQTAVFSLIGNVSSITAGVYDPAQQVYVTFSEKAPFEVVSCTGNVFTKAGRPDVYAKIILADEKGRVCGGHLFSETIALAGEIDLQELIGPASQHRCEDPAELPIRPK